MRKHLSPTRIVYKNIRDLFHNQVAFLVVTQVMWLGLLYVTMLNYTRVAFEIALQSAQLKFLSLSTMVTFFSHPASWIYLGVGFIILSFFFLFEDIFLQNYFRAQLHQTPINRINLLTHSIVSAISIMGKHRFKTNGLVWYRFISFNALTVVFATRHWSYLRYLSSELSSPLFWLGLLLLYSIVLIRLQHFELHLKKHITANLILGIFLFVMYVVLLLSLLLLVSLLTPRLYAVAAFLHLLTRFNTMMLLSIIGFSTLLNYALMVHIRYEEGQKPLITRRFKRLETFKITRPRLLLLLVVMVVFALDVVLALQVVRYGTTMSTLPIDRVSVTSHRGYSFSYPENTLLAVEKAMEVHADVVELDVRITLDNEFVIMHDDNVRRTTGVNASVSRLPLRVITSLDAGRWKNVEFEGERVPSLKDVLEFTQGRVLLNLDLKFTSKDVVMMDKLIEMIEAYDMQYQIMLTSTCLSCLYRAKFLNPAIQTGFITLRVTPELLADPLIDIISMRSTFVNQSIVQRVHDANKIMKVWTVNSRTDIERMSAMGVNNIISSNPAFVKEVLFELTGDRFIVNLIRLILD